MMALDALKLVLSYFKDELSE